MAEEIIEHNPKGVPKKYLDINGDFGSWKHVKPEENPHPPFPASENSKEEAEQGYKEFLKEVAPSKKKK